MKVIPLTTSSRFKVFGYIKKIPTSGILHIHSFITLIHPWISLHLSTT